MIERLKAYVVIAGLIMIGIAIGKSKSRREIVYVVRQ